MIFTTHVEDEQKPHRHVCEESITCKKSACLYTAVVCTICTSRVGRDFFRSKNLLNFNKSKVGVTSSLLALLTFNTVIMSHESKTKKAFGKESSSSAER